jgi:hypothetical protein
MSRTEISLILLILLALNGTLLYTEPHVAFASEASQAQTQYVLVGGQNGTWFEYGQSPRLYQIFLSNYSIAQLTPISGGGTVWTGSWNGSQWLVSGWGANPGPHGSNPYLYLYDGQKQIVAGIDQYESESSWHGGDVFAASYNGKVWLLSGLGSDSLPGYYRGQRVNHMSLAIFDGSNFTDLSGTIPKQRDAILYANAWNGEYWMVGGGYKHDSVLFTFNGSEINDLTSEFRQAIPSFGSVQSLGWNGGYWLIGGVGFLAKYDGYRFVDLTPELSAGLNLQHTVTEGSSSSLTVNALAWNGSTWMLGGGTPVAQLLPSVAWVATYTSSTFVDLTSLLPAYVFRVNQTSSVLTIAPGHQFWVIGGRSNKQGMLLKYENDSFTDISSLAEDMSYVNWVGVGAVNGGNYLITATSTKTVGNTVTTVTYTTITVPEFQRIALATMTLAIVATLVIRRLSKVR